MKEYELNIDLALEIPEDVDPEAFYLQILDEIHGLAEANNVKAAGPSSFVRIEADEWDYTKGPKPADVDHLIQELEAETIEYRGFDLEAQLARATLILVSALPLVEAAEDDQEALAKYELEREIVTPDEVSGSFVGKEIRDFLGLGLRE